MGSGAVRRSGWRELVPALVVAALVVATTLVVGSTDRAGAASPQAAATPAGTIARTGGDCLQRATGLTAGPDGATWFAHPVTDEIIRLAADGTLTRFTAAGVDNPRDVVQGADGALWFVQQGEAPAYATTIGRLTTAGAITLHPVPGFVGGSELEVGADGTVWIKGFEAVGRLAMDGSVTSFPTAAAGATVQDIAGAADGTLWLVISAEHKVARLAPDGAITVITDPAIGPGGGAATVGPDGNLWLADFYYNGANVRRITAEGAVTAFPASAGAWIGDIETGPDGALWYTVPEEHRIVRMTTSGAVTVHEGSGIFRPWRMAVGPGDTLVYSNDATNTVGSITTAGVATNFQADCARKPGDVAVAADGSTWFTNEGDAYPLWDQGTSVSRIGTDGRVDEFVDPAITRPTSIVEGPDGAMWFANGTMIGRITTAGSLTNFVAVAVGYDTVESITVGPDGALWFTVPNRSWVGRITTSGEVTTFNGGGIYRPSSITSGPDGALWFVNGSGSSIGRITTAGVASTFTHAGISGARSIVSGPDGALWFLNRTTSTIGRITTAGAVTTKPALAGALEDLVAGPDGWLWYTTRGGFEPSLVRMRPTGETVPVHDPVPGYGGAIAAGPDGTVAFVGQDFDLVRSVVRIDAVGAPGPSAKVEAAARNAGANVTWEVGLDGGSPITSTTVVAQPGGQSCTRLPTQTRSCDFSGLAAGVTHTFSVTASSGVGPGAVAVSNAVVPWSGSSFHGVPPTRILDSRTTKGGWASKLVAGSPRPLQVAGVAGVPPSATAVVLNVTVTDASAMSYLSVYPNGTPRPTSSSMNFLPGDTRANLVTVKLGTDGKVAFANAVGSVNVIADISGYYDDGSVDGGLFNPVAPYRAIDSRIPGNHPGWTGPLTAGSPAAVMVDTAYDEGRIGYVVNVTATQATNDTFITVYSKTSAPPLVSNLNVRAGETVANLAVVPTAADQPYVELANAVGSVHVIVDVVGYYSEGSGSRFHPIAPVRVLDNRNGTGVTGPWGPGQVRPVAVSGSPAIPATATAVAGNLTVTGSSLQSFVSVFPAGGTVPTSSSLNFLAGQTIANAAYVGLGGGRVGIFNAVGKVDVIFDVAGYFAPS